jgi:hypothetical protein
MKKKKSFIILIHILLWLLLSIGYAFMVEPVITFLLPGYHNEVIWLTALMTGLIFIFFGALISLIVFLIMRKRILSVKNNSVR